MCEVGARLQQKIVKGRPVGLDANKTGQRLARLSERPDLTRFEAHTRQRVPLSLSSIGGQQVVEVGMV